MAFNKKNEIKFEHTPFNNEDLQIILNASKTCRISDLEGKAFKVPWNVIDEDNNNGILLCVQNEEPSVTQSMKCRMINFLVKRGVGVDKVNKEGMTSLIAATILQEFAVVKCLLECGAEVNKANAMARTALHFAVLGKRNAFTTPSLEAIEPKSILMRCQVLLHSAQKQIKDAEAKDAEAISRPLMELGECIQSIKKDDFVPTDSEFSLYQLIEQEYLNYFNNRENYDIDSIKEQLKGCTRNQKENIVQMIIKNSYRITTVGALQYDSNYPFKNTSNVMTPDDKRNLREWILILNELLDYTLNFKTSSSHIYENDKTILFPSTIDENVPVSLEENTIDEKLLSLLLANQADIFVKDMNLQTPIDLFKQNSYNVNVAKLFMQKYGTTFIKKITTVGFGKNEIIKPLDMPDDFKDYFEDYILGINIHELIEDPHLDKLLLWFTTQIEYTDLEINGLWNAVIGPEGKNARVIDIIKHEILKITPDTTDVRIFLHVNNIRKTAGAVYFFNENPLQLITQLNATKNLLEEYYPESIALWSRKTETAIKEFLEKYYNALKKNIYRALYLEKQRRIEEQFYEVTDGNESNTKENNTPANDDLKEQIQLLTELVKSQNEDLTSYNVKIKQKHAERRNEIKDKGARKKIIEATQKLPPWNTTFNL